jgi:hypothetical protein
MSNAEDNRTLALLPRNSYVQQGMPLDRRGKYLDVEVDDLFTAYADSTLNISRSV